MNDTPCPFYLLGQLVWNRLVACSLQLVMVAREFAERADARGASRAGRWRSRSGSLPACVLWSVTAWMIAVSGAAPVAGASSALASSVFADQDRPADKIMREATSVPWWDREQAQPQPVELADEATDGSPHRGSAWERKRKAAAPSVNTPNLPNVDFSGVMMVIFCTVVAFLLVGIIAFLVWAFMRQETAPVDDDLATLLGEQRTDEQRIEALPFDIKRPLTDLLAAAEQARQEGQWRLAIIYLFSHLLVQLDRAHLIRLAKGKTNRQYLGELQQEPELRELTRDQMLLFERVFFGGETPTETEVNASWEGLARFQKRLEERGS